MNSILVTLLSILTLALTPLIASAQDTGDYHPFLSDKFHIGIGIFAPKKSFGIEVDGTVPEESIDFEESLNRVPPNRGFVKIGGAPIRGDPIRGGPIRGDPIRGDPIRGGPIGGLS